MSLPRAHARFETVFDRAPEVIVRAPGRINLIGEHVDYLDGLVMPMAIDRFLTIAVAPSGRREIRVWTERSGGEPVRISLADLTPRSGEESWLNYVVGVLALMRDRGIESGGFDAVITADLPAGAGLSSSAALETATALCVEVLSGQPCPPLERAKLCQQAEHEFAGVPCGMMDQLAVGLGRAGHALLIDCRDLTLTPIPIPDELAVIVADTGVKHSLADGEYRRRREDCEAARKALGVDSLREAVLSDLESNRKLLDERLYRRARHAVTEISRVGEFAEALTKKKREDVGKLMRASHESLRGDFEVSCDELDFLVDSAFEFGPDRGLWGSRMTGGGFGGSTVSLVQREAAQQFVTHLETCYADRFGRTISPFVTTTAEGAGILNERLSH